MSQNSYRNFGKNKCEKNSKNKQKNQNKLLTNSEAEVIIYEYAA